MKENIHNIMKSEYEKKRKAAFDDLVNRKAQVYSKVPRIQEIDREIQLSGIKYNKAILLGTSPADAAVAMLLSKIEDLKKEKRQLLDGSNFPPDCLEMVYECTRCNDTGYIENGAVYEKCMCYRQQLLNYLYNQSNLMLAQKENFSSFSNSYYPDTIDESKYGLRISPRKNIDYIKESALKFIKNFASQDEKNLFFCGPTGVGKTFMINCIAVELLNKGITVLYQTSPVLFNTINEYKMRYSKEDSYRDNSYKDILEVELLIIDDLGTEPLSAARYAELLTILNTRQLNNLSKPCKTIISTNLDIKDLNKYYDERIVSRIIGGFDMFKFIGEDIRSIKALGGKQ